MKRQKAKKPETYIKRSYRELAETSQLVSSMIRVKDTDLHVLADQEVAEEGQRLALQYRLQIERYIETRPEFVNALVPLAWDQLGPRIVRDMLGAAQVAGVGPMAAVAGVIAEFVGCGLLEAGCREVIVENGGDVFIHRLVDSRIAIFAGNSPLSLKVGLKLKKEVMPLGVCTSSGSVGHSLSFGQSDSVTVVSQSTALADAAATRLGNEVGCEKGDKAITRALDISRTMEGIIGVVVIRGDKIGAVGDVELVNIC